MPVDIEALLVRLKSGESSIGTIGAEVSSYASEYPKDMPEEREEQIAWFEKRQALANALTKLSESLSVETDATSALRLGRLMIAGASLLSEEMEMQANAQLGGQLALLNRCQNALGFFDGADDLYDKLTDKDKKYPFQNLIFKPLCLSDLQRYDELETYARRLIAELGESGPFYKHLGAAYVGRGRYDEAIDAFKRALELLDEIESPDESTNKERADVYARTGAAARSSGRYEDAIIAFEAARTFALKAKQPDAAALALSEQGITWDQIGERQRARKILERAATEADSLDHAADAARWRGIAPPSGTSIEGHGRGDLLTWAGGFLRELPPNTSEARRMALAAIKESQTAVDARTEAEARNILAHSYSLEGRHAQALAPARRAVDLAEKLGDKTLEMTYRTNLGVRLQADARIGEAEQELRTAITIGRQLRNSARTTEFRQAITGQLSNAYDVLSFVLVREWKGKDGSVLERRNDALVEIAQEARAGNFARWLGAERAIVGRDDLRAVLLNLRAAEVRLEMSALAQNSEITSLVGAQKEARQEFVNAAERQGLNFEFAVPVFSTQELRKLLAPGHYLLDLYAATNHVFATVIQPDGELTTTAINWLREDRVEFMRKWQERIFGKSKADWRGSRFYDLRAEPNTSPVEKMDSSPQPSVAELLAELRERLIKPLGEMVSGCRRLTIVPHRELSLVPYWLLAESAPEVRISLAPGTNIFKLLHDRRRDDAGTRLALGDVTSTLHYVPVELSKLPDYSLLPYQLDAMIGACLRAKLIHLAGHGQFNEANPYLAGLVVEPNPSPAGKHSTRPFGALSKFGEELLTVAEVLARVQLPRCFLAVLSACCSGLPRQHPASEFVGLPAAFLIAGANNVIGSLWPVDDGATCIMMQEFYAALSSNSNGSASVSAALAQARQRLRRISRAEVVNRLGSEENVPKADPPYDGPKYSLAFQHYGVD
jgi:tetratricopeptide (TPR) repeat protein